jgi:hypothetical protein
MVKSNAVAIEKSFVFINDHGYFLRVSVKTRVILKPK